MKATKILLAVYFSFCTIFNVFAGDLCIDEAIPGVLDELMDAAIESGADGEFLKLAISRVSKEMAEAGGKKGDNVAFTKRSILLSDNRIEDGANNLREGISGARIELQDGLKLRRPVTRDELGVDFFDAVTGDPISLKGPLFRNDMSQIPSAGRNMNTFSESVFKINTGVKIVYVDLFGLSVSEKNFVKKYVSDNQGTKGSGKIYKFVE